MKPGRRFRTRLFRSTTHHFVLVLCASLALSTASAKDGAGHSPAADPSPTNDVGFTEPTYLLPRSGGCGGTLFNADASYENGYTWQYGGIQLPDYGSFAEQYSGEYLVCSVLIDLTQTGSQVGQILDVYVWEDLDGLPGAVVAVETGLDPGGVAFWPSISRHVFEIEAVPGDPWWVGYWGSWPDQVGAYFVGADLDGPGGSPYTKIAPGQEYPTGWQNVSVAWGPTSAIGIGAEVLGGGFGACCYSNGDCRVRPEEGCDAQYLGDGTICDPNPCDQPPAGACCFDDGTCRHVDSFECEDLDGTFLSEGLPCNPNPCDQPPDGACCVEVGDCLVRNEFECEAENGDWYGEIECDPNPCPQPPSGACCVPSSECLFVTRFECEDQGGQYLGTGFPCDPDPCIESACCFEDGSCVLADRFECADLGGHREDGGVPCDPNPCPQPPDAACCLSANECVFVDRFECDDLGGLFLGYPTTCDPNPCGLGACCFEDGTCINTDTVDCDDLEGSHLGVGVPCDPNPCPQPPTGACCLQGEECQQATENQCSDLEGHYQGDDTECSSVECPLECTNTLGPRPEPLASRSAGSGPNEGGTLIIHWNPEIEFTDIGPYCGRSDLMSCSEATVDVSIPAVFYFIAAFPEASSPRLSGISIGMDYSDCIEIIAAGHCGDFELDDPEWPEPRTGTAVTWATPQTDSLIEVYWFAAYIPVDQAGLVRATGHPTQGGYFGDDAIPSNLDPIVDYGELGFYRDGYLPCPAPTTGACCLEDGDCLLTSADTCVELNGVYAGDGSECDPNPCDPVPIIDSSWGEIKSRFRYQR